MTTRDKLVEAAAKLLDAGGEQAVTLLGVGHTAGVSHNAPYKHFKNRDALLAAVATSDLDILTTKFVEIRVSASSPGDKLLAAIGALIAFCLERPSRYRLVFGAPTLVREHPELQVQSTACLPEIVLMVDECKSANALPDTPTRSLASLLLAAMHGRVLLEAQGQLRPEKGLLSIEENMALMVSLLAP
ncbi:TetR family transcriptional regulator [Azorhizobium oxalatiphilum]|uniref:TetR family transcriptional regulator n=1 Tax=Azorhizobium oxalatiphilum TaxID=980631 RepID=A0A917FJY1_9HYPH|nr:TetR/AcrR family transcriptional regulator [Azorhizobium oxalatiphilum]GGF84626.1 TetR family transcriptional regulator [Azorhizobium oxalatiphilum]